MGWELFHWGSGFSGWWSLLVLLVLGGVVLKGVALWKSAGRKNMGWFIALLVINSVGVLPVIYLLFFENKGKKKKK